MSEDLFPADLVPISTYDTRRDKNHDGHSPAYKAIVKAMDTKRVTRFQRGGRVYVSKAQADTVVASMTAACSSKRRGGGDHERRIADLERLVGEMRRELGIE